MHLGADCHRQCAPFCKSDALLSHLALQLALLRAEAANILLVAVLLSCARSCCARPLLERAHGPCGVSAEASSICCSHIPEPHTFASSCSVEATIVLATAVPHRSERARTWHGFDVGSNAFSCIGAM